MKRFFAFIIGLTLALVFLMPPGLQAADKPNIVLVFMDSIDMTDFFMGKTDKSGRDCRDVIYRLN
jgi:hypothetical protein